MQALDQKKREYSKISIKKRMQLVQMVLKKNVSLIEAVETLNIKITTARFIINKYLETGTYPRRKFRKTSKSKVVCKKEQNQPSLNSEQLSKEVFYQQHQNLRNQQVSEHIKSRIEEVRVEQNVYRAYAFYYPWFLF